MLESQIRQAAVKGVGLVQCKLCDRDVEKLVDSHIIPQSFYGTAFVDPKGPAKILSSNQDVWPTRSRVGEYDPNLLCDQCEASLSGFDDYAHSILFQTNPSHTTLDNGEELVARFDQIDTEKLRTFFISLLWRMHATDRPMFSSVRLGEFEARFKLATFEKRSDSVPEMDAIISKYDVVNTPVMGPRRQRFDGLNGYHISFAGGTCWIKVDSREMPDYFAEIALSRGSPLHVLLRDFSSSPERVTLTKLALLHRNAHRK